MNTQPHLGLRYDFFDAEGNLTDSVDNLVPLEGRNYLIGVGFCGQAQVSTWFLGLYEGDYTPTDSVTAATMPGLATECTAYTPSTRVEFQEAAPAAGATSNAAALAEFTFTAAKTLHGVFMSSASSKGSTSGILGSIARFPSPKVQAIGSVLRIFAGPSAINNPDLS